PASIRLSSQGIEWDVDFDASDFGDLIPSSSPDLMVKDVVEFLDKLWSQGFRKFFVMGGNHSVTIPVVEFLAEKGLKKYVQLDAHADFRQEFTGTKYSYASTLRRVSDVVKDVSLIGVRSIAEEETSVFDSVNIIEGKELEAKKDEVKKIIKQADYVSIDMDVLNIRQVTNPEPLYAMRFEQLIESLSGKKMGVDVVEGVPEKLFGDYAGVHGALIARKAIPLMH
ncbi:MAG: hypothetical protein GOV01_04035, partial [Candidatus Altiarchaeota archaeon]|nr:hypothetical protein [Candidatus Altiarchaeota archaeon]